MSKPKNMNADQEAAWKLRRLENQRIHRAANREKYNEYSRQWSKDNRARREELRRAWDEKHPECLAARARKARQTTVQKMTPSYIAEMLKIPVAILLEVPEVIEAKRQEILLKREISKLK